jgi:hypothetical protein
MNYKIRKSTRDKITYITERIRKGVYIRCDNCFCLMSYNRAVFYVYIDNISDALFPITCIRCATRRDGREISHSLEILLSRSLDSILNDFVCSQVIDE